MKKNIVVQIGLCLSVAHCRAVEPFLSSATPRDYCNLEKEITCNVTNNEGTESLRFLAEYEYLIVRRGDGKDCRDHLPFPAKNQSEMHRVSCTLLSKSAGQEELQKSGEGSAKESFREDGSIVYDCDASPLPPRDDFVATVKWEKLTETAIANLDGAELEMTCKNFEHETDTVNSRK